MFNDVWNATDYMRKKWVSSSSLFDFTSENLASRWEMSNFQML